MVPCVRGRGNHRRQLVTSRVPSFSARTPCIEEEFQVFSCSSVTDPPQDCIIRKILLIFTLK